MYGSVMVAFVCLRDHWRQDHNEGAYRSRRADFNEVGHLTPLHLLVLTGSAFHLDVDPELCS